MDKTMDEMIREFKLAKSALDAQAPRRMESHAAHDTWLRRKDALMLAATALAEALLKERGAR